MAHSTDTTYSTRQVCMIDSQMPCITCYAFGYKCGDCRNHNRTNYNYISFKEYKKYAAGNITNHRIFDITNHPDTTFEEWNDVQEKENRSLLTILVNKYTKLCSSIQKKIAVEEAKAKECQQIINNMQYLLTQNKEHLAEASSLRSHWVEQKEKDSKYFSDLIELTISKMLGPDQQHSEYNEMLTKTSIEDIEKEQQAVYDASDRHISKYAKQIILFQDATYNLRQLSIVIYPKQLAIIVEKIKILNEELNDVITEIREEIAKFDRLTPNKFNTPYAPAINTPNVNAAIPRAA